MVILTSLLYLNFVIIHTNEELLEKISDKDNTIISEVNSSTMGSVVMPNLNNSTLKAELGQSSWKLIHTMMARFPENPTEDEKDALRNFVYLFGRLYPCGECATEFQKIIIMHPPQVSSREAASQWACAVHNIVNERLKKEIFDCGKIAEKYKCGCDETSTFYSSFTSITTITTIDTSFTSTTNV
ncbi:hypothetical protein Glove_261g65 [Diversispora epigaea]|uniref:Sulfhydryl oxidase n=1 Tax=Diversispora epigaea TaxID=1348612 RepID=A0A397I7S5_9GLOM|nr:hypothetical protein Glove_261g65 [Diversispora epigaea]